MNGKYLVAILLKFDLHKFSKMEIQDFFLIFLINALYSFKGEKYLMEVEKI